jgi:TIR domain-containing protein
MEPMDETNTFGPKRKELRPPMKVFVSWSGKHSFKIAIVLRDWLPSVIQALEPYVSSVDIDKGARWGLDIAKELEESTFGILCVTPDNMEAPWLNFEAGALSKKLDKGRVTPFLVSMRPAQLSAGPLTQFQATLAEKEDVWKLVKSLNEQVGDSRLEESKLRKAFDKWWPELEEGLALAVKDVDEVTTAKLVRKDSTEILEELLESMWAQQRMLADLSGRFAARAAPVSSQEFFLPGGTVTQPLSPHAVTLSARPEGDFTMTAGRTETRVTREELEAFLGREGVPLETISTFVSRLTPKTIVTFYLPIGLVAFQRLTESLPPPTQPPTGPTSE